tara:strand:- start:221 stop:334 length:114 start_codon:yes stop_codon:yes gene_type:complete
MENCDDLFYIIQIKREIVKALQKQIKELEYRINSDNN